MNPENKNELKRLVDMLKEIDTQLEPDSRLREGLIKAMLFMEIGFMTGHHHDVDILYQSHPSQN
jgi:hypothetical protein